MTEWEKLGVRFIFDGKEGFAGLEEMERSMLKANKVVTEFTQKTATGSIKTSQTLKQNFKGAEQFIHKETEKIGDDISTVSTTFKTMVNDIAGSQRDFFAPIQQSNALLQEGTQTVATWSAEVEGGVLTVQKTFTAGMPEATKSVETFKRNVDGSMQTVRRSLKDTADSAEKDTRRYVRSIALIYAVFRQAPQLAEQFGTALKEAAAGEDIRRSFYQLAEAVDVSSENLLRSLDEAAKGTLSDIELMRVANRAFLAGGKEFATALPELFLIARSAAVATGKDLQFVFDTLITGIARASPKLIDNAEIYLKIGDAVDEYAEKTGRATDELSAQEKINATLQAVLRDGRQVVKNVGADAELASDAFNRMEANRANMQQGLLETANYLARDITPAFATLGKTLNQIAPILQTIALLKMTGQGSLLAGLGLGGLAAGGATAAVISVGTAMASVLTPILAVKIGVDAYDQSIRHLAGDLPPANQVISETADVVQYAYRIFRDGAEAADEWFRAVNNMKTLAEANREVESTQERLLEQAGLGEGAYWRYMAALDLYNRTLERGQLAVPLLTKAEFELNQVLADRGSLEEQIAALERLRENTSRLPSLIGDVTDKLIQNEIYTRKVAYAAQQAAAAEEELNKQLEIQQRFRVLMAEGQKRRLEGLLEITNEMQEINAKIKELESEATADIEKESKERTDRIWKREINALWDREDAYIKFQRAVRDAERERTRAIEDINRQHKARLEDIEWDYQRRILEIEEQYQRTVRQAAIERDALAILQARERRADELREAGRDRQDQIRDEQRDYLERLLQADRSYQDRLERARQALQDELVDLQRKLQRELELERQADAQRLVDQKKTNQDEIDAEKAKYAQLEIELQNHLNRTRSMINKSGIPRKYLLMQSPTDRQSIGGQHGFEGMVTGPQGFHVEPGVKEYVYMSGDLRGGRQPVVPSAAAAQAQNLRTAVSGAVGVGLSGFSESLLGRIGPALREQVGQAIIDEIADAFMGL